VIHVPARELATEAGTDRAANFVMLGAYVGATGVVDPSAVEEQIEKEFTGSKARHVPANVGAFRAGLAEGRQARVPA
jgi:2-oxoglutarate ferredoxin oxidoreductase subunit gamma